MRVLNGKYIEVTDEYAKEALKLSNSTDVLSELRLNAHDFTKIKAYVKDIYDEVSNTVSSIETIEFFGPKARLLVINTDDGKHKDHVVMADVLKGDGFTSRYMAFDSKVEKLSDTILENDFLTAIPDGLIHDESFQPLKSKPDDISEEMISFCIPEYKHCGPDCGDGLKFGGGEPINEIDSCCRDHDRCYEEFGWASACCDKEICRCVLANHSVSPIISDMILLTFIVNSRHCKQS